jgi:hypothetical protein
MKQIYYGKPRPRWLALLFLCALWVRCTSDLPEVHSKESFPKQKLEKLGGKMLLEMLNNYQFLPDIPPYDTSIYWYLQTLYDQATTTIHRDRQSPSSNRWDQGRTWKVFIIKNDTLQHAFSLPGGDFLISTGLLKKLETDHELYALLAFEATLMHRGYQLELLIQRYNAQALENIADGIPLANDLTAATIAAEFPFLEYDVTSIEQADKETVATICETSILHPTGLAQVAGKTGLQASQWLQTRPNYGSRESVLQNALGAQHGSCGGQTGASNYQRFVLNMLD